MPIRQLVETSSTCAYVTGLVNAAVIALAHTVLMTGHAIHLARQSAAVISITEFAVAVFFSPGVQ